jgi:hypothetical protein
MLGRIATRISAPNRVSSSAEVPAMLRAIAMITTLALRIAAMQREKGAVALSNGTLTLPVVKLSPM